MSDNNNMELEKGTIGLVGWFNQRLALDGWELDHKTKRAKGYCNLGLFKERFSMIIMESGPVLGSEWLVRLDNEDHLYFSSARCVGLAMPSSDKASNIPHELLDRSLIIHFQFKYPAYGPYHIAEAKAMARNGNDMFTDLLTLNELDRLKDKNELLFTPFN